MVETGWRTTEIRTRNNEVIVLPNTYLAREPLVNYARPDPRHCDTLRFEAAYEAPPNAVKAAVLGVLRRRPVGAARRPSPRCTRRSTRPTASSTRVRYWLEDFGNLLVIRDRLLTNIWYALRRAGVRIPFPATDLFVHASAPVSPLEEGDVAAALARVPLLAPLTADELARARRAGAPPALRARRGDRARGRGRRFVLPGRARRGGGDDRRARRRHAHASATWRPGDYFGEMSLLTGEPRSATVVAEADVAVLEVGRAAFEQILAANPALLEPISQIAAHRQEAQRASRRAHPDIPPFAQDPAAQRLRQRIRAFFGL